MDVAKRSGDGFQVVDAGEGVLVFKDDKSRSLSRVD